MPRPDLTLTYEVTRDWAGVTIRAALVDSTGRIYRSQQHQPPAGALSLSQHEELMAARVAGTIIAPLSAASRDALRRFAEALITKLDEQDQPR